MRWRSIGPPFGVRGEGREVTGPTVGARERPILMHARSVRGILAGTKTQTRRVAKARWEHGGGDPRAYDRAAVGSFRADDDAPLQYGATFYSQAGGDFCVACPFGQPGDRLWVREAWALPDPTDRRTTCYRASGDPVTTGARWRPSIHMPRWASRLTLEVTEVRVQRVQEITGADAAAEGFGYPSPVDLFAAAWDSLNARRGFGWAVNPYVWALTFRVVEGQ